MGSARLACLIHVASIHPGPGSNPQKENSSTCVGKFSNSSRQLQKILLLFPFLRKKGLCWLYMLHFFPHSNAFHYLFDNVHHPEPVIFRKKIIISSCDGYDFSPYCDANLFAAAIAGLSSFLLFFGCFFCHLIFSFFDYIESIVFLKISVKPA